MAYSRMIFVMLAALFLGSVIARSPAPSPSALSNSPAPTPEKTTPPSVSAPSPINSPASPPFPDSSAPVYPPSLPPSISTPPSDAPAPAKNSAALSKLSVRSIVVSAFVAALAAWMIDQSFIKLMDD